MAQIEFTPMTGEAMSPRRHTRVGSIEAVLGAMVEIPAAILVVAEVVILFAGVVSRYVMHSPLIWSDELASILFLWLAMLGAVVALRRAEHMRMTAIVANAKPAMRAYLEMVATCAALAFLLLIVWPAYDYAYEESFITTPALQISNSWRAAALPVGTCLMAVFALLRLVRAGDFRVTLAAMLSVVAVMVVFWLAQPWLRPLGNLNLIIFFVGVAGFCVFAGVPIAFGFGLSVFGYLALTTHTPLMVLVGRMDEGMSHLILLAVPLFVFLGLLIEMTGMARAMVAFLASLLGHVRGGLHYVLLGAMYLVSGISGSKAADMAAVAPVLFPEMKARGARPGDLVALLAATGAQTETIPPSLVLITIGSVTGVSISALFTGGLLPGVVLAITLSALVWWRYRREDLSHVKKARAGEVARTFVIALPALALPFVIRAAVVEGIATATEVSTIGIVYGFLIGLLFYRHFDWRRLLPMLVDTACLSGAILLIIGSATGMAWGLTQSGFSHGLAVAMTGLPGGAASFIAVSIVAFVILGSVLEGIPAIVLFGPL
ncbi:MAG TPA: TRAP transporter large permease subunit, partial [Bradyrhizobium sp.]